MEDYKSLEIVGRGHFSQIYRAVDRHNVIVALKSVCIEDERPPHDSVKELEILKKLGKAECSKNIIRVLDHFYHHEDLVIVLPYFQFDLESLLSANSKAGFPLNGQLTYINKLPEDRASEISVQLAQALKFVHSQGIIHRDIKPQNVLFKDAQSPAVLCDFGISWVPPDNNGTELPDSKITDVGTGVYRAPELLFGVSSYASSLDMWGLGCVISQMFTSDAMPIFDKESCSNSDIALIIAQFKALGTPTLTSWPDAHKIPSFVNMSFTPYEPAGFDNLTPRASSKVKKVLFKLLCFQASDRLTAEEVISLFEHT